MKNGVLLLFVWGMAFGYMEGAVVVYLRGIYYPDGFAFPLKLIAGGILWTEIGREAATLLIMAVTVMLVYRRFQSRLAAFAVLFGVWDIFYYVFLKLLLGWPGSLQTWDILFLIPAPWLGPVWAPLLVSVGFVSAGTAVLVCNARGRYPFFGKRFVLAETAAGTMIVAAFLLAGSRLAATGMPEAFARPLFCAGLFIGAGAFVFAFSHARKGA